MLTFKRLFWLRKYIVAAAISDFFLCYLLNISLHALRCGTFFTMRRLIDALIVFAILFFLNSIRSQIVFHIHKQTPDDEGTEVDMLKQEADFYGLLLLVAAGCAAACAAYLMPESVEYPKGSVLFILIGAAFLTAPIFWLGNAYQVVKWLFLVPLSIFFGFEGVRDVDKSLKKKEIGVVEGACRLIIYSDVARSMQPDTRIDWGNPEFSEGEENMIAWFERLPEPALQRFIDRAENFSSKCNIPALVLLVAVCVEAFFGPAQFTW